DAQTAVVLQQTEGNWISASTFCLRKHLYPATPCYDTFIPNDIKLHIDVAITNTEHNGSGTGQNIDVGCPNEKKFSIVDHVTTPASRMISTGLTAAVPDISSTLDKDAGGSTGNYTNVLHAQ
ncbi:hypothetical protein MAR_019647, partial [Mya arenaria]